jgi:hypothetical protein
VHEGKRFRQQGEFKPLGSDVPPPESAVGRDHCAVLRTGRTVGWGSVGCPSRSSRKVGIRHKRAPARQAADPPI